METLIEKIRAFNKERHWDKFHSPKNLAMAFNVEAAEKVRGKNSKYTEYK